MTCRKLGAVSWLGLHIPPLSCAMLSQCLKLSDPVGRVVPPTLLGMSWGRRGGSRERSLPQTPFVCVHTPWGELLNCSGVWEENKGIKPSYWDVLGSKSPLSEKIFISCSAQGQPSVRGGRAAAGKQQAAQGRSSTCHHTPSQTSPVS